MVDLSDSGASAGEARPFRARCVVASRPAVVEFTGDFDLAAERVARDAIAAAWSTGAASLVIDLSGVDFMDSTGVMSLLSAQAAAESSGRELSLRLGAPALRTMELCGVLEHFELAP